MPGRDDTPTPFARGIPLGRYRGVEIVAHWSALVVVALLSVMLAGSVLPVWQPHRAAAAYWLVAAITAVGFVATLLAHELAHTVVARHYGMPVRRITLWLLGGMSELENEPPTPRADAVVAAAGPVTSLGFGGSLTGLAYLAGHGLPATALGWLAGVNLLLGAFNLLPGAPLDGGRLVRAAVWAHTRDRSRAVNAAARAGHMLGFVLLVLGIVESLAGAAASGIGLVLVGWFIATTATAERYADVAHALRGLTVRDVMTVPPATAPSWWTVADFLIHLGAAHLVDEAFVLVDFEGRPTAVLTIAALTRVSPAERGSTRLRDCRGAALPLTVTPEMPLGILAVPLRRRGGIAVVAEDGRITATVTSRAVDAAAERARLGLAVSDRG